MEFIDEPSAIRKTPAFISARTRLAAELRKTPTEQLGDSLDMQLFEQMRPHFVRVLLLNSDQAERGEREGILDLAVKAPFSHSKGKIVTRREMREDATAKEDELSIQLGVEWSTQLMHGLDREEHVAALKHAYSLRSQFLYNKIAAGHWDILALQERFDRIEEHCRTAIERVMNTSL